MNPVIPMWALTGHPTKEHLEKQLESFNGIGIERIMLYPRYGYEYEYMGEEWHRICGDCISFASKHSMKIWLYDEVNWPSGSCAGRVARKNESYRSKRLATNDGAVVIEYADPDKCKFATDVLDPDAVDCFISMTHEKYYEWFGKYFGNTIEGVFADEPGFSYFSEQDNPAYYDGAFEDYKRFFGRDAKQDFLSHNESFYSNWYHMLGIRFRETYLSRIANWCGRHNIKFTGHLLHDNYICRGVQFSGNILKSLDKFDVSGVDEIWNDPNSQHIDFAFSQIAALRVLGKREAMAELFAYGPASLPYIRMKQMIWYAAAYGINRYFTAIAHLDIRGNRGRRDFFHDFSPSSPDWNAGARELVKSAAEAATYADKIPAASVAIRYPYRAALEFCENFGKECPAGKLLWKLTEELTARQITFSLVSEESEVNTPVCFEISNNEITETVSKKSYVNAIDAVEGCFSHIEHPVQVFEKDGTLAKDLLVRTYTDGSYIVVEKSIEPKTQPRLLVLHQNGTDREIQLPAAGVITDKTPCFKAFGNHLRVENISVRYDTPNVFRADNFFAKECKFKLNAPLCLEFSKRVDEKEIDVLLDGKKLEFSETSRHLPMSMKDLYRTSQPVFLAAGEHCVVSEAEVIPHFPTLLAFGDFHCEGNVLSERTNEFVNRTPFFGKASLCFELDIPADSTTLWLSFDDNRLVSELFVNEKLVSACAFAPYVYRIPQEVTGKKAKIELAFYSGYAPLFGDLDEVNRRKKLSSNDTLHFSIPEKLIVENLRVGDGELLWE